MNVETLSLIMLFLGYSILSMGRQKTYNDQLEKEVIELLKKGKPLAYISDKTGLGVTPIRNIKSSLGLVNKRKVSTENIEVLKI